MLRSVLCYRKFVCRLSSVCSCALLRGWNFRQYFFAILYLTHPLTSVQNFTETIPRGTPPLRHLRQMCHSLPTATLQMLVVALVHSRLDYGNSVLVGRPAYLLRQLLSVVNAAARLVHHSESSRPHHRGTFQSSLVRAPERILHKTAVLTHKALHGGTPRYLSSPVHVADVPGRLALRTAGSNRLQIPPFKLSKSVNRRRSSVSGRSSTVLEQASWHVTSANSLSDFWQQLKCILFQQSFPDIIIWHFLTVTRYTHGGPIAVGIAT